MGHAKHGEGVPTNRPAICSANPHSFGFSSGRPLKGGEGQPQAGEGVSTCCKHPVPVHCRRHLPHPLDHPAGDAPTVLRPQGAAGVSHAARLHFLRPCFASARRLPTHGPPWLWARACPPAQKAGCISAAGLRLFRCRGCCAVLRGVKGSGIPSFILLYPKEVVGDALKNKVFRPFFRQIIPPGLRDSVVIPGAVFG